MDDEIDFEALGRRVVACKHWRWLPGMREVSAGAICVRTHEGRPWIWAVDEECVSDDDDGDESLPDLRDPATLGCLLALVREAWGPGLYDIGFFRSGGVRIDMMPDAGPWPHFTGSVAEALVSALESAP